MGSELVAVRNATPVGVQGHRALGARPDAIAPVIFVGEAAAGPAHVRHVQRTQCREHVVAQAAGVRNDRVLPDPHAFIDAAAEMLGELAVDVPVDDRAGSIGVDRGVHGHHGSCRRLLGEASGVQREQERRAQREPAAGEHSHESHFLLKPRGESAA